MREKCNRKRNIDNNMRCTGKEKELFIQYKNKYNFKSITDLFVLICDRLENQDKED